MTRRIDNFATQCKWSEIAKVTKECLENTTLNPDVQTDVAIHATRALCPIKAPTGVTGDGMADQESAAKKFFQEVIDPAFVTDAMKEDWDNVVTLLNPNPNVQALQQALKAASACVVGSKTAANDKKKGVLHAFANSKLGKITVKNASQLVEDLAKNEIQEKQVAW